MKLSFVVLDPDSYGNQAARRKRLYHWLRETNESVTEEEVSRSSDSNYLKALFSLVSGQQLSKACRLAQQHRDHKLALLLSQAAQNTTYNRLHCVLHVPLTIQAISIFLVLFKGRTSFASLRSGTGRKLFSTSTMTG